MSVINIKYNPYLRVGVVYYKKIKKPLISGDSLETISKWSKQEIITDEGDSFLKKVPKYDGFCTVPSHINYKPVIDQFYNEYKAVRHNYEKGEYLKTEAFLKHLFGDQYILFLDYLTILWQRPIQILPILCLVSTERKTGKTTLLYWLKLIFQANMTTNTNEDFRSRFNSDWVSKLIIAIDEVLLDKREDSERIKNLSTTKNYKVESKGKDKVEGEFFGKFILCSNNEDSFIKIDNNEIRYWVVKVSSISEENPNLLNELKKELPNFMGFINSRKIVSPNKTRMWFTKEQIYTPALKKLMKGNMSSVASEIECVLKEAFIKFEVEELKYTISDIVEFLLYSNITTTKTYVSKLLKDYFNLGNTNGSYTKFVINTSNSAIEQVNSKGRYFTFKKSDFDDD
tara:strand:- start:26085 stop:27281 length:1197 start_codon:yes stop_codon:yes gene_type:complete